MLHRDLLPNFPGFVKAKELIDEISAALKSSANVIEQTDKQIGSAWRG